MASKKLVRLTWIDETGEAYHTADLSPSMAREQLKRAGADVVRVCGMETRLRNLTRRAIEESSRGATAECERGCTVLITLPEDNPEQEVK